jgi:hypothetical protein
MRFSRGELVLVDQSSELVVPTYRSRVVLRGLWTHCHRQRRVLAPPKTSWDNPWSYRLGPTTVIALTAASTCWRRSPHLSRHPSAGLVIPSGSVGGIGSTASSTRAFCRRSFATCLCHRAGRVKKRNSPTRPSSTCARSSAWSATQPLTMTERPAGVALSVPGCSGRASSRRLCDRRRRYLSSRSTRAVNAAARGS